MKNKITLPDKHIKIDEIIETENEIRVKCHMTNVYVKCFFCGQTIKKVHSLHVRHIQDLPVRNKTVFLDLSTRSMDCRFCRCKFEERLRFAPPTIHMTTRLREFIGKTGTMNPIFKAEKILNAKGVKVKHSTIATFANYYNDGDDEALYKLDE